MGAADERRIVVAGNQNTQGARPGLGRPSKDLADVRINSAAAQVSRGHGGPTLIVVSSYFDEARVVSGE
jgi:hypothetical protein